MKPNLVYEVEMGPFKHVVDDGLDLRKAAFEWYYYGVVQLLYSLIIIFSMYTLAEQCLDRIDVFEYMNYLENGLKDLHDIKLLTFLMLIRLVSKCPMPITQRVDRFCDLIKVRGFNLVVNKCYLLLGNEAICICTNKSEF